MTTPHNRAERIKQFRQFIIGLQASRDDADNNTYVHWESKVVPLWHKNEMRGLLAEINSQLSTLGCPTLVTMAQLIEAEQRCQGHSDYTDNLAIRAADLSSPDNKHLKLEDFRAW